MIELRRRLFRLEPAPVYGLVGLAQRLKGSAVEAVSFESLAVQTTGTRRLTGD